MPIQENTREELKKSIRQMIGFARRNNKELLTFTTEDGLGQWSLCSLPTSMNWYFDDELDPETYVEAIAYDYDCTEQQAKVLIADNALTYGLKTCWLFAGETKMPNEEAIAILNAGPELTGNLLEDFDQFIAWTQA